MIIQLTFGIKDPLKLQRSYSGVYFNFFNFYQNSLSNEQISTSLRKKISYRCFIIIHSVYKR